MDAKLFKGFTALINTAPKAREHAKLLSRLEDNPTFDPTGSQWRGFGFTPPINDDEFFVDIQGAGHLACVEINERNLPGTVVREEVANRILKYREETGREKLSKKQIMEIKDEVVAELLPKAFIRRKLIPIMFIADKVVVFSTSAKVVDDVASLLVGTIHDGITLAPLELLVENNIDSMLTILAKNGTSEFEDDDGEPIAHLAISNVGTLKGPAKQTITIKDKDIASHDMQELLKQDYTVVKLGVERCTEPGADADAGFTLNSKLVFSQFKVVESLSVRGKSKEDAADTFMATAYIVARGVADVLDTTIVVMGGLRAEPKKTEEEQAMAPLAKATAARLNEEEDDEL